jgi:retron-type reverse transcriptase
VSAADKPFSIDKELVYEAYKAVRANAGGAGVDGQTIEQFEAELGDNLYKLWNRMSSGSYFPPPVRAVAIPKKSGGQRLLGVRALIAEIRLAPNRAPVLETTGVRPRFPQVVPL